MLPKRCASLGEVKVTTASARNAPGESGWRESASQPEGDSAQRWLKAGADDRVEEEVGRFEYVEDRDVVEVGFLHEQKGRR
jgi:hypothetical protein